MPKAAVDEDDLAELRKDQIGLSRQVFAMKAKTKSQAMDHAPHRLLRRGVAAFDRAHDAAAELRRLLHRELSLSFVMQPRYLRRANRRARAPANSSPENELPARPPHRRPGDMHRCSVRAIDNFPAAPSGAQLPEATTDASAPYLLEQPGSSAGLSRPRGFGGNLQHRRSEPPLVASDFHLHRRGCVCRRRQPSFVRSVWPLQPSPDAKASSARADGRFAPRYAIARRPVFHR